MAFVCEYSIIRDGQFTVFGEETISFDTEIDGEDQAIFQLMFRGLGGSKAEVLLNGEKVVELLPYAFASENDWFQWTFVTRGGLLRQNGNQIVFRRANAAALGDPFAITNLICFYKQDV